MLAKTVETGGGGGARTGTNTSHMFCLPIGLANKTRHWNPHFSCCTVVTQVAHSSCSVPATVRANVHLREYAVDMTTKMSAAWESAKKDVKKSQKR